MYELKAEDFALWNFKLITALTWKYGDSFVAFTAADLSDASQDDRLSNSFLETECTDAFQQSIDSLFGVAALSSDKVSQFLAELVIEQAETEVEGRTEPDPRMKIPMPDFLQSKGRFTPSEILLQKLASKCAWTEAEMAQVVDLLRSPQFNADDIGLDLSRKVNLFHTISYCFILFHTIS